jgi:hypothetical protein
LYLALNEYYFGTVKFLELLDTMEGKTIPAYRPAAPLATAGKIMNYNLYLTLLGFVSVKRKAKCDRCTMLQAE